MALAALNSQLLAKKALQRDVLRRIVWFNTQRLVAYLDVLVSELQNCIAEFDGSPDEMSTKDVIVFNYLYSNVKQTLNLSNSF